MGARRLPCGYRPAKNQVRADSEQNTETQTGPLGLVSRRERAYTLVVRLSDHLHRLSR
jgi:hypothetical protein